MANKKTIIILCSVAAGLLLAGLAVWLTLGQTEKLTDAVFDPVDSSAAVSLAESLPPVESAPVESEVTVKPLCITNTKSQKFTVTDGQYVFEGQCDPTVPLTLNGEAVAYDSTGAFRVEVPLQVGNNKLVFDYNGAQTVYQIYYRYIVIHAYSPNGPQKVDGNSTLYVTAVADQGAAVTATFNGQTVSLQPEEVEGEDAGTLRTFFGNFQIPAATGSDQNLGKVQFNGSHNGYNETFSSGDIVCKAMYIPKVAEVVNPIGAETFNGNSADNCTRPTNNYFPKGTVDYVTGAFSGTEGKYVNNFLVLQCGRRIYSDMPLSTNSNRVTVSKVYEGFLPDHNELSVASVSADPKKTELVLNTTFKAPFFLDLLPQRYTNPTTQDYTVSSFTAQYVEIKFCYATVFSGEISFDPENPLFSRAEVIPSDGCTVVRLYLKKTGRFYGWDCYYNFDGQLVFEFYHPVAVQRTDQNEYGADLSGAVITIDAGHGGKDCGAVSAGGAYESVHNLILANMIWEELAKTGATVKMTRTGDTLLESPERTAKYRESKPDFLVAVHHDSSTNRNASGLGIFYGTPFSQFAAQAIYNREIATGIFGGGTRNQLSWHYFYMVRMTYCPSVLTENGYMSNANDMTGISDESKNRAKAKAIAQGIADYFLAQMN